MSVTEIKEMKKLQSELMGESKFSIADFSEPKWVRLNELTSRWQRFVYQMNKAPLQTFNQIITQTN